MPVVGIGECSLDIVVEVEGPLQAEAKSALPESAFPWLDEWMAGSEPRGPLRLPGYPAVHAASCQRLAGGQVATAMLGCARLGLTAVFAGAIGDDEAGARALHPLRRGGVDLRHTEVLSDVATRTALILVEPARGERAILERRDSRLRIPFRPEWMEGEVQALLVDGSDLDAALQAAHEARRRQIPIVLDLDVPSAQATALLELADFAVVSRAFAEEHAGTTNLREAMRFLREAARSAELAVITLGGQGVVAAGEDPWIEVPAFAVTARDTTGAGDAFRAGLLWGLVARERGPSLLRRASAVGALNCLGWGAQGGLPDEASARAFLEEHDVD